MPLPPLHRTPASTLRDPLTGLINVKVLEALFIEPRTAVDLFHV